jgi:hypothetical protein
LGLTGTPTGPLLNALSHNVRVNDTLGDRRKIDIDLEILLDYNARPMQMPSVWARSFTLDAGATEFHTSGRPPRVPRPASPTSRRIEIVSVIGPDISSEHVFSPMEVASFTGRLGVRMKMATALSL